MMKRKINLPSAELSLEELCLKMEAFCAYEERCERAVREQLYVKFKTPRDVQDVVIEHLLANEFLDDARFARAFVRGKFRIKKWGKMRIVGELRARNIDENTISNALTEIEDADYLECLQQLLEKKNQALMDEAPAERKNKLAKYALQKGFEQYFVFDVIKNLHY